MSITSPQPHPPPLVEIDIETMTNRSALPYRCSKISIAHMMVYPQISEAGCGTFRPRPRPNYQARLPRPRRAWETEVLAGDRSLEGR